MTAPYALTTVRVLPGSSGATGHGGLPVTTGILAGPAMSVPPVH
jgi:hypothetical protein